MGTNAPHEAHGACAKYAREGRFGARRHAQLNLGCAARAAALIVRRGRSMQGGVSAQTTILRKSNVVSRPHHVIHRVLFHHWAGHGKRPLHDK